VGEATNKLVGYLAAVSRKLDEPLAVLIQSTSAASKSSLMEAILAFVPEEERVKYSAVTGQSLYYLGDLELRHKAREFTGWSDFQVRIHLDRLVQMKYLLVHRGRRGQSFLYELLYDGQGQDGKPFLIGLIDVEKLRPAPTAYHYDKDLEGGKPKFEGVNANFEPSWSPHSGPVEPPTRKDRNATPTNNGAGSGAVMEKDPEKTRIGNLDSQT
jgi:hypothetical protein